MAHSTRDHADSLDTQPIDDRVRYNAFLGSIRPERRVGDFVHCTARLTNAIFKRLIAHAATISPQAVRDFNDFKWNLDWDSQQLPLKDRYAPRLTKPGDFDLTSARQFVTRNGPIAFLGI